MVVQHPYLHCATSPPPITVYPCHGVCNEQLQSLINTPGHYGFLRSEHFLIASQIEAQQKHEVYKYATKYDLETAYPSEVAELDAFIKTIPLYHSTAESLRSTVCVGFSLGYEPVPCACCEALLHDDAVQARIRRASAHSGTSKSGSHLAPS